MAGSIPIVTSFFPQWQGPSGGDVANSFLNAFFSSQQNLRQNQNMAMQQDQFAYERDVMRPLREQGMQLDLSEQKQRMKFAAQDQEWQQKDRQFTTQQRQYETDVLRPLNEAQMRNQVASSAFQLQSQQQELDAKTALMGSQMMATKAIEDSINGLAGFGASLRGAPAELPVSGKVTSYGYKSDPTGDSASLGTGEFKVPTGAWNNQLSTESLAISPDVERQFKTAGIKEGDMVHLRLANGDVVTRRWDDRTMQDAQATEKFGKPLTGRFDFYSPDGVHSSDGSRVVGFARAGKDQVTGMEAGPVKPEQINQALNQFDTLVNTSKMLPPGTPARIRADVAITTAMADPVFSGMLKQREVNKQNAELGMQVATDILSTPTRLSEAFKQQHEAFANVQVIRNNDGTYDVARNTGMRRDVDGRVQFVITPMDKLDKTAFIQAYTNFRKEYSGVGMPDGGNGIAATTLKDYMHYASIAEAAGALDPTNKSDAAEAIRIQAPGAMAAMAIADEVDPTLNARAMAKLKAVKEAFGGQKEPPPDPTKKKDEPVDEEIPLDLEDRVDPAVEKAAKLDRAADEIATRVLTIYPDKQGSRSFKENPALGMARKIHLGLDVAGKRKPSLLDYLASAQGDVAGMPVDIPGKDAAESILEEAGLAPDEIAADGITNLEAIKHLSTRILKGHKFATEKNKKAAASGSKLSAEDLKLISDSLKDSIGGGKK